MNLFLENKVAIITGSTQGIGEAIAVAFAAEGAHTVITGRNQERASLKAQEITEKFGAESLGIGVDLAQPQNCKEIVDATLAKFGSIDILVNNAGGNDTVDLDAGPEAFIASLNGNLVHYYAMVHFAKQALIKSKGNIVNIGSKVANLGQGKTSGYAAAKGAIQGLTREWAVDLLDYEIRVNEVIPAEAWTESYKNWINTFPNPEAKLKTVTDKIPLGKRMTTSEELANMVVFVASQRASHITGQHLYVDGGYTHLDRSI
ncbi:SDR family oxidoreductase [Chondrinema litorale]|uniref:SDR family oxidoreductase n=1 Tax=Chondrinema litorale TaxID=2994555 RepID=UPI002542D7D7|nr:SDR family oxidoreductase [Chondrinema litorale]UZR95186.1 SDR family oxidoreductase [Chondrinema litorale]